MRGKGTPAAREGRPPPLDCGWGAAVGPQSWGWTHTHVLERPPVAAPQPPPRVARPQTTLPAAEETRDAESFPARRFEKGRSQVPVPSDEGLGWSGIQAGRHHKRSQPSRTPHPHSAWAARCSPSGLWASRSGGQRASPRIPTLQKRAGRKPGPKPGWDASRGPQAPARAWGAWVCFIYFLNWREGTRRLPLVHSDPR